MAPASSISHQYFEPIRSTSPSRPRLSRSLFTRIIASAALISVFTTLFAGSRSVRNEDRTVQHLHMLHVKNNDYQRNNPSGHLLPHPLFNLANHFDREVRSYEASKPFSFPGAIGKVHVVSPDTFYTEVLGATFVEVRVRTGDCTRGLSCRARLVVSTNGDESEISAGYWITSVSKQPTPVSKGTISKVKAITDEEFMTWAERLVKLSAKYVENTISVQQVYDALRKERDTAITCKSTADEECHALLPVAPAAPKCPQSPSNTCSSFWDSMTTGKTFEQIKTLAKDAECDEAVFFYNRLGVESPLCKAACTSKTEGCPDTEKTVYAYFYVQDNNYRDAKCMASSIKAWHDTYTVPDCSTISAQRFSPSEEGLVNIYDKHTNKGDAKFAAAVNASASCGGDPDFIFFDGVPVLDNVC